MHKRRLSLSAKLALVILAAFVASLLLYLGLDALGQYCIETYYLSDQAIAKRQTGYQHAFARYVLQNNLASSDRERIVRWTRQQQYVYLIVYQGDELLFESGWWDDPLPEFAYAEDPEYDGVPEEDAAVEGEISDPVGESLMPVQFRDGVFTVSITDFSEVRYYDLVSDAALLAGLGLFMFAALFYARRIIRRINRLSREVLAVEQGELNRSIALRGSDEIALLARDVDRMRRALLGQIENERAAWEANRELITAMSHDIRTPLTSLLGYLDIIDHGNYRDAEQLRQYVSVSRDKALQLKELSDKLFQYFLLYGNRPMPLNWQTLGAAMLLEQLLGERALYLRSHGFYVEEDFGVGDCQIATDTAQLCRLFDNLFSNIEKYADPAAPVSIVCGVLTGRLRVRLGNAIRRLEDPVESTRVGLKTCEKIAQQLGGSLEYGAKGNYFSVAVIFPIVGAQRQGKDETN